MQLAKGRGVAGSVQERLEVARKQDLSPIRSVAGGNMRDQYAGDISDMLKYSLLRALAGDDRSLGVGWYYNPEHDGKNNGLHTEYLADHGWSKLDACVWEALQTFSNSERLITTIEGLPIWPKATRFHRTPVPDIRSRYKWATEMAKDFNECELVFLDPDNGVGNAGKRHTSLEEIKLLRSPENRSLVVIKFPGRVPFDQQVNSYHSALREGTDAKNVLTIRTSVSVPSKSGYLVPRFQWFTLIDHDIVLAERLFSFAQKLNEMKSCRVKANVYPTTG